MKKPDPDPINVSAKAVSEMLASGCMLPAQFDSTVEWSPEQLLAATVLADALLQIREHHQNPIYEREVAQDLRWIRSEDTEWPYSFVSLCDALGLEPSRVRKQVFSWTRRRSDEEIELSVARPCRSRSSAQMQILGRRRRRTEARAAGAA